MADPSEMVERVARVIHAAVADVEMFGEWEEMRGDWHNEMRKHARAAIAAMREPTEAMLEAANDAVADNHAGGVWRSMVDAALPAPPASG